MQLQPYLHFNGDCETAFKYYERVLGGKIEAMMTHAGTPQTTRPGRMARQDSACPARRGRRGADGFRLSARALSKPQGFTVSVQINDTARAEAIFRGLADGGTVTMPFAETFWAARFGMLVDKFGTPWMVNCDRPA